MGNVTNFFNQLSMMEWVALAIFLLGFTFVWWQRVNQLTFFDFLVKFPIRLFGPIGLIKALKKQHQQLDFSQQWTEGMPSSECELCDKYIAKMKSIATKSEFENALEYLQATGQGSTIPMAWWMWAILFILTVGEALGTGALFSEFVSTNVTMNEASFFAWAIAIVLAVVLLGLTHKAGDSFADRMLIKNILGPLGQDSTPDDVDDKDKNIYYSDDQFKDRGKSQKARFFARLEQKRARGSLGWSIAAVILLSLIMGTVFGARIYGIQKQTKISVTRMEKNGITGTSSNPFKNLNGETGKQTNVPPDVKKAQQDTRKELATAIGHDTLGQGLMASILLSVFYVLVQLIGFAMSMKHSFFSMGEKAYKTTRGYTSYKAYRERFFNPYAQLAQTRLAELRNAYAKVSQKYKRNMPTISFRDYFQRHRGDVDSGVSVSEKYTSREITATANRQPSPSKSHVLDAGAKNDVLKQIAKELVDIGDPSALSEEQQADLSKLTQKEKQILADLIREERKVRQRDEVSAMDSNFAVIKDALTD